MQQTGAKKFYPPSADYIWPHTMNKKVRQVVTANGGSIVGGVLSLDHADYAKRSQDPSRAAPSWYHHCSLGVTPFLEQLHDPGFTKRGGKIARTYDENFQHGAGLACRGPQRP